MKLTHYPSLSEVAGSPMRSDRLLNGMQKVIGHDLPNQLVVLQSLLQLVNEEESSRLSKDGREYVRRLLNAAQRAGGMVRFLKEMAGLNAFTSVSEIISLTDLARELQGALQRLRPGIQFDFDWQWSVPAILGDSRVYGRALLELCMGFMNPQASHCRLSARSEPRGEAVELTLLLVEMNDAAPVWGPKQSLDERMEVILAREWLALCGAGLEFPVPAAGETSFSIVVPKR
jgi:light-regulated signal transduction histidine kinase (bacteriophytochrome)